MNILRRLRDLPGVLIKDAPKYLRASQYSGPGFRGHPKGWTSLANRGEKLVSDGDRPGRCCTWAEGTTLHAPMVFPPLGSSLFNSAFSEWPIELATAPNVTGGSPKVSFVFAHAGIDRLSQLRAVLQSVYAQIEVECECIVVDQSKSTVCDMLPPQVRSFWLDTSGLAPGWRKSWAYNVGARMAKADILVFQDGDICVPVSYAAELVRTFEDPSCGAASLQRFLFYFDQATSERWTGAPSSTRNLSIGQVRHNWKGGTIAIRKQSFLEIGGFDEGFVDWGGEDDEFYDRCAEVGHVRSGYLPFVHLWHAPQAERKSASNRNTLRVLPRRMMMNRQERIAELCRRRWGQQESPDPSTGYE